MSRREAAPPSKTRDRGATPTAPQATAPTRLPTPATTEGNGGNCYPSLIARGLPGSRAQSLSWPKDRRGGGIAYGSPLLENRAIRGSCCFSASSSALRALSAWFTAAVRPLDQEEAASLLLSHCAEWDVFFITAVAAFHTQRFQTCMMAASLFLHWVKENRVMTQSIEASHDRANARRMSVDAGSEAGPLPRHHIHSTRSAARRSSLPAAAGVTGEQEYQCRLALLVRAWSNVQAGERLQVGKDAVALLDYAEDSLSYHVGCALALFGLPLPAANKTVMNATAYLTGIVADTTSTPAHVVSPRSFSPAMQGHLHVLTESVHALTFLHLGMVEPALQVAKAALDGQGSANVRQQLCRQ